MKTQGIEIEKGVPMIEKRGRPANRPYDDVLRNMEDTDSFVLSGDNINTMNSMIRAAARRVGVKVVIRRIEDDENGEVRVRVWRVGLVGEKKKS